MFPILLRGGPPLVDDTRARVIDAADPVYVVERRSACGETVRFRITGDYELVDGQPRRVYAFEDVPVESRADV